MWDSPHCSPSTRSITAPWACAPAGRAVSLGKEEAGGLMETLALCWESLGQPWLCLPLLSKLHLLQQSPLPAPQQIFTFCLKHLTTTPNKRTTRARVVLPSYMGQVTKLSGWEVAREHFPLTEEPRKSLGFPEDVSHALSESSPFSKLLIRVSLW